MKKFGKQALVLAACGLALMGGALAAGLGEGDSLISLSYLNQTYVPQMTAQGMQQTEAILSAAYQTASDRLDRLAEDYLHQAEGEERGSSPAFTRKTLSMNDILVLSEGSGLILEQGSVILSHAGTVVDVTTGKEVPSETELIPGHRYLTAEGTRAAFLMDSDAVRLSYQGDYMVTKSGTASSPFTDIRSQDWYRDAVRMVYSWGLFAGTGDGSTFAPNLSMDRAMMMTVLFHLAGNPEEERSAATKTFSDVPEGEWYTSYVRWAAEQGVSAGYGGGVFKPLQNMTRREVVQFLYNFGISYLGLELTDRADLSDYEGVEILRQDGWGEEAMSWAVGAGIISTLGPLNIASRAEVAAMLANFMEKYF